MIAAGVYAYYAADSRVADDAEYVVSSILRAALGSLDRTRRTADDLEI
jgi:hypothetical protein